MRTRLALISLLAAALTTVAVPSPSFAAGNNNNATIDGVISIPADESAGCASSEFCMFTGPTWSGRAFRMHRCGTYTMRNWNGYGSWTNSNIDGAHGYLKNRSGQVLVDSYPGQASRNFNFAPVWFVTPC